MHALALLPLALACFFSFYYIIICCGCDNLVGELVGIRWPSTAEGVVVASELHAIQLACDAFAHVVVSLEGNNAVNHATAVDDAAFLGYGLFALKRSRSCEGVGAD